MGDKGLPGSMFLPHPSSSSPGSQNNFLWFLDELLPKGTAAPAFLPTCREARQEGMGSHHPSSHPSPLHPKTAAGGGGAGMGDGEAAGALWDQSGAECSGRGMCRREFCFVFPWRGGRLLMLIPISKNRREEEKLH